MGKLSGQEIHRQVGLGNIVIDPFDPSNLGANSYDLHLGPTLLRYRGIVMSEFTGAIEEKPPVLDMKRDNPTVELKIPDHGLLLRPGILYLGHTLEYTVTNGFVPILEGRSSVARLGMSVHLTAGFGDHGFAGDWTLEITVVHPLRVYAGVRICQIAYEPIVGEVDREYRGKYQQQRGPQPSQLWRDFADGKVK